MSLTDPTFLNSRWDRYIAAAALGAMPPEAVYRAREIVLDTLACAVAGATSPVPAAVAQGLAHGDASSVPGKSRRATESDAALATGISAAWNQLDETNLSALQHPAVHVVPPAFAVAEAMNSTLGELLEAVIVGYEIGARVGRAVTLRSSVHAHGTHGTIGGTAAAAKLMASEPSSILQAMNLAASTVQASDSGALHSGSSSFHAFAGLAGQHAVTSARLAAAGVTANPDALVNTFSRTLGVAVNMNSLVDGLGEDFLLLKNLFKFEPYCADLIASVRALEAASADLTGDMNEIREIQVWTHASALDHLIPRPDSTELARFSLPFVLSLRLAQGPIGFSAFSPEAIHDPLVLALADKVRANEDRSATESFPDTLCARVRIHTGSSTFQGDYCAEGPTGTSKAAAQRLSDKARALMEPVLGEDAALLVADLILHAGWETPVREISRLLRPELSPAP